MNENALLMTAVKAADDKRAEDITVLNMKGISLISDYFVICHANSDKQVQAIAREMKEKSEEHGYIIKRMEGFDEAKWILVDMGDIVAHIFHRDERAYYNLERLWGDAPVENVQSMLNQ
ncbi:ribosome silencing factor [Cytobacillus sp. NCCP-133]|uniref:ribosome silencing factor n=1 Tax=Cytobacillus sp. NCCP-133 TaxID=766848 RepID=UPI00222E6197|nr:ribosome silencing factor [Cytobacillus sp. NCCP-133]GLB58278.1 ribosomal silencing factor RsfS [Cytobacillus sp. NCCP-133]